MLSGLEEVADFQIIRKWEETTETGDRAEIETLPEAQFRLGENGRAPRDVYGAEVHQFERCFITLMHQRALESDIIIVNHHLFFADLALKEMTISTTESSPSITPPYSTRRTRSRM